MSSMKGPLLKPSRAVVIGRGEVETGKRRKSRGHKRRIENGLAAKMMMSRVDVERGIGREIGPEVFRVMTEKTVAGVRIVAVMTDETRKKGVETIGIGIEIDRGAAVTRGTTIVAVQGKTIIEIVDEKNETATMNHREAGSAVRRTAVATGGAARIVRVGPILNLQQLLGLHLIFVFASFPKSSQKDDSTSRRASSSMFFPGVLTEQSKWQTAKSSIASRIDI
mmetsp:Transcript_36965/g.80962  ORF Transcript_36965/g.80962 Transcript_36965/m.80962 type:complete len:223 (-) Transcript_36965:278-946(-)